VSLFSLVVHTELKLTKHQRVKRPLNANEEEIHVINIYYTFQRAAAIQTIGRGDTI
jgi:hypothetical protein